MGVSPLGRDFVWENNLAARAAWMSYVGNMTQGQIAKTLGVSAARVQRLIQMAREAGLVRISIEGRPAECLTMEAEIAARFDLKSCTISPYLRSERQDLQMSIASVGQVSSQILGQHLLLPETRTFCVGSGPILLAMLQGIPNVPRPDLDVIAAAGNLGPDMTVNPYDILSIFAERTGGKAFALPAPFYCSNIADRELFLAQPAIAKVLARTGDADIMVAEVGALAGAEAFGDIACLRPEDISELKAAGAVAEFAGAFINAAGQQVVPASGLRAVAAYMEPTKHRRARQARVFALAASSSQAEAVLAVLHSKLATDLIIDEGLAMLLGTRS